MREESLAAIERQHSILKFGFAGISLLLGFAARIISDPLAAACAYLVIAPLAIDFIVVLWLGEVERMERAGAYLADLESIVRERYFPEDDVAPLGWETWLREGGHDLSRLVGGHYAHFALFGVLGIFSVVIGIWILASNEDYGATYALALTAPALLLLAALLWWQKRYPTFETWDRTRPPVSRARN